MTYDFSNANSIALLDIELSMIVTNEVWQAISVLKNNKVTGIDQIPVELLKTGRDDLVMKLTRLLNNVLVHTMYSQRLAEGSYC